MTISGLGSHIWLHAPPASRGTLPCLTGLWSHPHMPFRSQACCIYQCLCLGSFSLDQLLFFPSLCLHTILSRNLWNFAPLTALSASPGLVIFLFLLLQSYSQHCTILITTAIGNGNFICCCPWFNKQTPQGQGPGLSVSFALVSELFHGKHGGCPPAASVSHWRQNSLRKENKVGPQ